MGRRSPALSLAALVTFLSGVARAQPIIEITPPVVGAFAGRLGHALAELNGNILATSDYYFDNGRGFLFDEASGALLLAFVNPDPTSYEFGFSAASVGGNALIGARGRSGGPGAAFLFDGGTGALIREFPDPAGTNVLFGRSVAALGDDVLVGAPSLTAPGAAYLFDGATGTLLRTFQAPSPANEDFFGGTVAVLGSNVLVGAYGSGAATEAVYLFDGGTGALLQTFLNPNPASDGFGVSIAVQGVDVLVGAPTYDGGGPDSGIVYLFDSATGGVIRSFEPPAPLDNNWFGASLAPFGGHVLIGMWKNTFSHPTPSVEVAFVFDVATGTLERTLWDPRSNPGDLRLTEVAVVDGHLVASSPEDDAVDANAGALFVYCGGAAGCGPCETCGPSGTCMVAPNPTCHRPTSGRAPMRIVNRVASDDRDLVSWRVTGVFDGPAVTFGTPTDAAAGHDYALCVYDESGGPPSILFNALAPAGGTCGGRPCWKPSPGGYRYGDADRTPDGVVKVIGQLSSPGSDIRTRLKFLGRGTNLSNRPDGIPPLPLPLPLRVQLQIRESICWEAEYPTAPTNTPELFRATAEP
jgi:hypothetical protein